MSGIAYTGCVQQTQTKCGCVPCAVSKSKWYISCDNLHVVVNKHLIHSGLQQLTTLVNHNT